MTLTVTSSEDALEDDPSDDTAERTFALNDLEYALDGLGVHSGTEVTSLIGTASFADATDNVFCLNYFRINAPTTLYGLNVDIGANSRTGALMIASVHGDSLAILPNALGGSDDVFNPLATSQDYTLSAADTISGEVSITFLNPVALDPGAYYAGVELFSNGGTANVTVVDDATVPQPSVVGLINIQGTDPGSFTNGNAFAIRMIFDPTIGFSEVAGPEFSMFPNAAATGQHATGAGGQTRRGPLQLHLGRQQHAVLIGALDLHVAVVAQRIHAVLEARLAGINGHPLNGEAGQGAEICNDAVELLLVGAAVGHLTVGPDHLQAAAGALDFNPAGHQRAARQTALHLDKAPDGGRSHGAEADRRAGDGDRAAADRIHNPLDLHGTAGHRACAARHAAAPPIGGGTTPAAALRWDGFTIAKNISDADAEVSFQAMVKGHQPRNRGRAPRCRHLAGRRYQPRPTAVGVIGNATGGARAYPMQPYMGLLHTALSTALTDFITGKQDADQALADVKAAYDAAAKEGGFLK